MRDFLSAVVVLVSAGASLAAAALVACSGSTTSSGTGDAGVDAGPASLTSLSVTVADGGSGGVLSPAFSPDVYDYYVRCAAGTNSLHVSMTAQKGALAHLEQPTTTRPAGSATLTVSAAEGQAVVAVVTQGKATTQYWVRCLPHDFPSWTWTDHPTAGTRSPGYYLMGVARPASGVSPYAFVLDSHGVPVWYTVSRGKTQAAFNVDDIVSQAISFFLVPAEGYFVDGTSPPSSTHLDLPGHTLGEHELRRLDGGHFMSFGSPPVGGVDLTGLRVPEPDGGVLVLKGTHRIVACHILEFTESGTLVWDWNALDHFDPLKDTVEPADLGGDTFDVFHCNSIDVDPANGNLLVSARELNSVFYVERATGHILWKMGGSAYTTDNAAYVKVADPFVCEHDARLLPGWKETCSGGQGQISVFDDQSGTRRNARGVVYDVSVGPGSVTPQGCDAGKGPSPDAGPAENGNARVVWQYSYTMSSQSMGSFRVQPDGTRVIGWGQLTPSGFTELDSASHVLLDFVFDGTVTSYRVIKVPLDAFDLNALRAGSGKTM